MCGLRTCHYNSIIRENIMLVPRSFQEPPTRSLWCQHVREVIWNTCQRVYTLCFLVIFYTAYGLCFGFGQSTTQKLPAFEFLRIILNRIFPADGTQPRRPTIFPRTLSGSVCDVTTLLHAQSATGFSRAFPLYQSIF